MPRHCSAGHGKVTCVAIIGLGLQFRGRMATANIAEASTPSCTALRNTVRDLHFAVLSVIVSVLRYKLKADALLHFWCRDTY